MQLVIDALRATLNLRAVVANVEMSPAVLLDRQLARLAGVPLDAIVRRKLDASHAERIDRGLATLETIADRLAFIDPPYDLGNVAATADDFGGELLALDYLQRICPPGGHTDKRYRVDALMDYLRQFADAGVAVIVVSAIGRSKDRKGRSSYAADGLNLASYRESSELEFGADDAFILHPDDDDNEGDLMTLKHLKSRYGECRTLTLRFDRPRQSFTPTEPEPATPATRGKLAASLRVLWGSTPAAAEDNGGDE